MTLREITYNSKAYNDMVALRDKILRKPLNIVLDSSFLLRDKAAILIGSFEEDKIIGCCILSKTNQIGTMQLRQMAVANDAQGKGVGRAIVNFSELLLAKKGCKKIMLHARKTAVPFYAKLGYKSCGDEFIEVNIPHYVMEKEL